MRLTVSPEGELLLPQDILALIGAGPGDQVQVTDETDSPSVRLWKVGEGVPEHYGVLGSWTSTDQIMDELRGPVDTVDD